MNMLTVALVVFACAIVVFFSREFGSSIKKIMAITGMKLCLPLILVSILVVYFEEEVLWCLTRLQYLLLSLRDQIKNLIPFPNIAIQVANVLLLMIIPLAPVFAFNLWYKRKNYYDLKYMYLIIVLIWLAVAVLLNGVFQ